MKKKELQKILEEEVSKTKIPDMFEAIEQADFSVTDLDESLEMDSLFLENDTAKTQEKHSARTEKNPTPSFSFGEKLKRFFSKRGLLTIVASLAILLVFIIIPIFSDNGWFNDNATDSAPGYNNGGANDGGGGRGSEGSPGGPQGPSGSGENNENGCGAVALGDSFIFFIVISAVLVFKVVAVWKNKKTEIK